MATAPMHSCHPPLIHIASGVVYKACVILSCFSNRYYGPCGYYFDIKNLPIPQSQSNLPITYSIFTLVTFHTKDDLDSPHCSWYVASAWYYAVLFRRSVSTSEECFDFGGAILFRRRRCVRTESWLFRRLMNSVWWSCLGGDLISISYLTNIIVQCFSISHWSEVILEAFALKLNQLVRSA